MIERPVAAGEIGKRLCELSSGGIGLRVYRDGKALGFREQESEPLREWDLVVEIVPTEASLASEAAAVI